MTQKEKLYFEYLTIKNSIYAVKGETDKQINLDEFCKKGRFWKEAKDSTVADLQRDIENAKRSLEQYKRDKKRDEWFATPEGAQWKQDKEAEITCTSRNSTLWIVLCSTQAKLSSSYLANSST